MTRDYLQTGRGYEERFYLHRIVADACVPNPRPDLFNVVDHINGKKTDNRPCNLRWVNVHLNSLNRNPIKGFNCVYKTLTKSQGTWGDIYITKWVVKKCGRAIQYFSRKLSAIKFAKFFNNRHFFQIHTLYVNSPEPNTQEWYTYWEKNTISNKTYNFKQARLLISGEKNIVSDEKYKKLTTGHTKIIKKAMYETWWEKSERNLKLNKHKKKNGHLLCHEKIAENQ